MACLPRRLWRAQLGRLGLLAGAMFLLTALSADGVPPVSQARVDGTQVRPWGQSRGQGPGQGWCQGLLWL